MEKLLGRLRFKKEAPTTMADARIQDVFPSAAADDLSSWEIVDPSDDDESEDYAFGEDEDGEIRVVESLPSDLSTRGDLIDFTYDHQDLVQEDLVKRESIDERFGFYDKDDDNGGDDDEEEEEEEEEEEKGEEDGYGYDLDDELVPKSVSDRFGRQRLIKLGKRAYPKMNKSKRLPYYYNRPGCVHGKHGLGLKLNINF